MFPSLGLDFSFLGLIVSYLLSTCFPNSKVFCSIISFPIFSDHVDFLSLKKFLRVGLVRFGDGVKLDGFVQSTILIQKSFEIFSSIGFSDTVLQSVILVHPVLNPLQYWVPLVCLTSTSLRASEDFDILFFICILLSGFIQS